MPMPVSRTITRSGSRITSIRPRSVYEQALRSRLLTTTWNTLGGACSRGRACRVTSRSTGLLSSSARAFSASSMTMSATSKSSLCGSTSASRARMRKASITASMSRPARWMRCRARATRGGESSAIAMSLATRITVSGVRSSWLASRVKSRSRATCAVTRCASPCRAAASWRASPCTSLGRRSAARVLTSGRRGSHSATCRASQLTGETSRLDAR